MAQSSEMSHAQFESKLSCGPEVDEFSRLPCGEKDLARLQRSRSGKRSRLRERIAAAALMQFRLMGLAEHATKKQAASECPCTSSITAAPSRSNDASREKGLHEL